jgi:hypothetical protein
MTDITRKIEEMVVFQFSADLQKIMRRRNTMVQLAIKRRSEDIDGQQRGRGDETE